MLDTMQALVAAAAVVPAHPVAVLSIVLGRASIFFWIWAQFPQIYTNWKLKSARSLSPKFLLYWWAGDITALIGCLLTNQLAFQRDMAIYSCVVDGILLFQYVYYTRRDRRRGHGHGLPASAGIPGGTTGLGLGFGDDSEADDPSDHTALGPLVSDSQVLLMSSSSLRTFSAPGSPPTSPFLQRRTSHLPHLTTAAALHAATPLGPPARLGSPLHLGGAGGHTTASPAVTPALPMTPATPMGPLTPVQTPFQRASGVAGTIAMRAVFLFALVPGGLFTADSLGRRADGPGIDGSMQMLAGDAPGSALPPPIIGAPTTGLAPWQQQVGVVAAWFACACYISSRVPQIWRNAQRRSVQGLSMAMFVAAALGNATYALSLLLAGYDDPAVLVDSLPYLVGSSVPVFFDVVIYTQSVMYNKPRSSDAEHAYTRMNGLPDP